MPIPHHWVGNEETEPSLQRVLQALEQSQYVLVSRWTADSQLQKYGWFQCHLRRSQHDMEAHWRKNKHR